MNLRRAAYLGTFILAGGFVGAGLGLAQDYGWTPSDYVPPGAQKYDCTDGADFNREVYYQVVVDTETNETDEIGFFHGNGTRRGAMWGIWPSSSRETYEFDDIRGIGPEADYLLMEPYATGNCLKFYQNNGWSYYFSNSVWRGTPIVTEQLLQDGGGPTRTFAASNGSPPPGQELWCMYFHWWNSTMTMILYTETVSCWYQYT